MTPSDLIVRLQDFSKKIEIKSTSSELIAKKDVFIRMPIELYKDFCERSIAGAFFSNPRFVFMCLVGRDLMVRFEDQSSALGLMVSVSDVEGAVMPKISDFWPAAKWQEREVFAELNLPYQESEAAL